MLTTWVLVCDGTEVANRAGSSKEIKDLASGRSEEIRKHTCMDCVKQREGLETTEEAIKYIKYKQSQNSRKRGEAYAAAREFPLAYFRMLGEVIADEDSIVKPDGTIVRKEDWKGDPGDGRKVFGISAGGEDESGDDESEEEGGDAASSTEDRAQVKTEPKEKVLEGKVCKPCTGKGKGSSKESWEPWAVVAKERALSHVQGAPSGNSPPSGEKTPTKSRM